MWKKTLVDIGIRQVIQYKNTLLFLKMGIK
jgi:hypothetical protein